MLIIKNSFVIFLQNLPHPTGGIKEIDVLFTPAKQQTSKLQILGLLGRLAENPAIIEPYRNPASTNEICDCILKLLEVKIIRN